MGQETEGPPFLEWLDDNVIMAKKPLFGAPVEETEPEVVVEKAPVVEEKKAIPHNQFFGKLYGFVGARGIHDRVTWEKPEHLVTAYQPVPEKPGFFGAVTAFKHQSQHPEEFLIVKTHDEKQLWKELK